MRSGQSYLFVGSDLPFKYYEKVAPIDRLFFAAPDLDIKAARAVVATSLQQPFGAQRLVVITIADQLSEAVQNTLLKLLEEPPLFLTSVLVTERPEGLLATVRSRLHRLGQETVSSSLDSVEANVPNSTELKSQIGQPKDRQSLVASLEAIRRSVREKMLAKPTKSLVEAYKLLDRSLRRLGQNANQKLVIDALLLNWPL